MLDVRGEKLLPSLGGMEGAHARVRKSDGTKETGRDEETARLMHNLSQLKQEDVSQRQVIVVKMVIARRNFIRRIYFRG